MRSALSTILTRHAQLITVIMSILIALSFFGIILIITKNPLSLDDGLRHFIMAKEQLRHGIGTVTWSNYFFSGYFVHHPLDPWFLADLSYAPFTIYTSGIIGIKVATFVFLSVLALSFSFFLHRFPTTPFFTALTILLFFFGSETFGFRLMLGRPFVLVSALSLLVLYTLITRRFVLLSILLALSALFSHLFIFPFGIGIIGSCWWFCICRSGRDAAASSTATIGGTLAGMLLHPQSSEYFYWMKNIFFVVPFSKELDLGGEVYSGLGFSDIGVYVLIIACILFFFLLAHRRELTGALHRRPEIILFAILTLLFFCAYLLWVRAIDLFWPIGTILLLSLLSVTDGAQKEARRFLLSRQFPLRISAMHVLVAVYLLTAVSHVWHFVGDDSRRSIASFNAIEAVPTGSTVFNVDWEYFPVLFFLRSDLLYARGMDPTHDDLPVRALISELHDTNILPQEPLFSREWFQKLWSRVDIKRLGLRRGEEAIVDTDSWLMEVRSIGDPQYLALYLGAHPLLIQSLKERNDLPILAESRAMIIFSLRPDSSSGTR